VAFLGRTNGPRAGWLLASLDLGFVVERFRAAAGWRHHADSEPGGTGAPGESGEPGGTGGAVGTGTPDTAEASR
jgi:hypothetical protein